MIKNKFQVFKIAKFEFKVTVGPTLWPMGKMHQVVAPYRILDVGALEESSLQFLLN